MSVTRSDPALDHVTPYDRCAWSDSEVEHLLLTGEHPRELCAYFGVEEYQYLVRLARQAHSQPLRADAPHVYIVPGIMGSQLGCARREPLPNDVIWLDPVDISIGQLAALRLPPASELKPLGIVLFSYLRLKLHLRDAGFAPICHAYDWRLGVDELGATLAARLESDAARIMIVAHSMGGLVSRAALRQLPTSKVERIVLLGTPNQGSFAPVQALRGVYAVVRKIARLSHTQSAESLAAEVFGTFPSLYHLLPTAQASGRIDFFDPASWPSSGPGLDARLLAEARTLQDRLAKADDRFVVIAGHGQETVTHVARRKDEFVYTVTRHGDGTVPLVCAELDSAKTYYTSVAHSELTRDPRVALAIADVLHQGSTRRLERGCSRASRAQARISDSQLRRTHVEKVDWAHLEPEERRIFLQTLNEPPHLKLRVPASANRRK